MPYCTKCGAQVTDMPGVDFCPNCGAPIKKAGETQAPPPAPPPAQPQQAQYQQPPYQQQAQTPPPPYQQQAQTPPPPYQQGQTPPPPYQQQAQTPPPGYVPPVNPVNYNDPVQDWQANKVYGILAYIGFLVLVTIFAAPKESRYSRFHANQGLILFIIEVVIGIVFGIISAVGAASGPIFFLSGAFIGVIVIRTLLMIGCIVLAILGIINAAKGIQKPLPVIGSIHILN